MQRSMKAIFQLAVMISLFTAGAMLMSGCHTMEGVGYDLSAAGQGLADVAADINPAKK